MTDPTTPTTEAGRKHVLNGWDHDEREQRRALVLAIEAEAAASALSALRAEVEGMGDPWAQSDGRPDKVSVALAAHVGMPRPSRRASPVGEPQTLRDSAWTRMEERIEAMPPGVARTAALMDMNVMLTEHRDALRAALASPDSLRLDPEDPESVARRFHEAYERLAPAFGYVTRRESAVPWEDVPESNRRLMVAVVAEVFAREWKASALPDPAPEAQA